MPSRTVSAPGILSAPTATAHGVEFGDSLPCIRTTVSRYIAQRKAIGEYNGLTAKNARAILGQFADSVGPDKLVARISTANVETWLEQQTCAASTAYSRLCTVRAFTKWCVAHRLLKTDPCGPIRGPRRPAGLPRSVDPGGMAAILAHCDERLAVCALLGAQEGLRRAEMAALSTSDVDRDDRVLRVMGKGQKERFVPLSDETARAIDTYLLVHPAGPHQPLLRSYNTGRALVPDTIGIALSRVMKEAGVKRAPWDGKSAHALRHTCAGDMLDHGADVRDVQEMLGHAHVATTGIYLRRQVALGRLRDAASGRAYASPRGGGAGPTAMTHD